MPVNCICFISPDEVASASGDFCVHFGPLNSDSSNGCRCNLFLCFTLLVTFGVLLYFLALALVMSDHDVSALERLEQRYTEEQRGKSERLWDEIHSTGAAVMTAVSGRLSGEL